MQPTINERLLDVMLATHSYSPQTTRIATHLRKVGSITGVEAAAMFKTRSLSRRVTDIRKSGVAITSAYRKDSTGQRYVRYVLS